MSSIFSGLAPTEQDVENLLFNAKDPITLETFSRPVSLFPCGHSLSQDSAQFMYNLTENLQVRSHGSCPTCRTAVRFCIPNHSLRQLLEGLISRVEASAATVLPCVTIKLAEEVPIVPLPGKPIVPFPGKGARFECAHAWNNCYSGASLCREMKLISMTPASFLQEIDVCGHQDGSIILVMEFRKIPKTSIQQQQQYRENDVFERYISDSGFQPHLPSCVFYARTPAELNWVLTVLANHNEVPQQEFQFIKRLVETQGWRVAEQEMGQVLARPSAASVPSALSASHNAEQDVDNLLLSAKDPVTLQLFNKPVSLVPCGHSLSQDLAQIMYDLTDNLQIRRPGTCPTCRVVVGACIPNHSLRQLLEGLISRVQASAATMLPCVTIKLATEVKPVVPFPGNSARFECTHAWSEQYGGSLRRSMILKSVTPASFLEEIGVHGYQDGSINFVMVFRETPEINTQQKCREHEVFGKFVSDSGFQPRLPPHRFYARTPSELNWVLEVLANHNEVPQQEFQFMARLVEAHGWRTVEQAMRPARSSSSSLELKFDF